jgi:hypothetical protein
VHPPLSRRPQVAVARPAAVVMVACASVHAAGAVLHWSPGLSLLTLAVAAVCLHCVPHLWRAPRTVDWVWVTVGSAAMLALHLFMLAQPAGAGHVHAAATLTPSSSLDALTVLGLVLPLIGFGLAWWALGARPHRSLGVGVPVDDHRADRGQHR